MLRAALFYGLAELPVPNDPALWIEAVPAACEHGLAQHLVRLASDHDVQLTATSRNELRAAARQAAIMTMAADSTICVVADVLESVGTNGVMTKGPGVARADPLGDDRSYVDIDLLVRPAEFGRVESALLDRGFVDPAPAHLRNARTYDLNCREAVNLVHQSGYSVDIHHHVPPWAWGGRLLFDDIWSAGEPVAGALRIAHPAHNTLICALHLLSDKGVVGSATRVWRDVAVLAAAAGPDAASVANDADLGWWLGYMLEQLPEPVRPTWTREGLLSSRMRIQDRLRSRWLFPPSLASRSGGLARLLRLPLRQVCVYMISYLFPSGSARTRKLGAHDGLGRWYLATWRELRSDYRLGPARTPWGARQSAISPNARAAWWVVRSLRCRRRAPHQSTAAGVALPLPPAAIVQGTKGRDFALRLLRADKHERTAVNRRWNERLGSTDPLLVKAS